ncbi:MAG: class I SAM-dependent methyltransferase [Firmicutes bacterium]|nr:class I SAM-dependent methyltransferase [Bacillota bacterium]
MSITQEFYDNLAVHYNKLFLDWQETTKEQAVILDKIFSDNGYSREARVLDCACGIGTQTMGLASLGYNMAGSDISSKEVIEAKWEAIRRNLEIRFEFADFCNLADRFKEKFDIIIAIDNALPHASSKEMLKKAVESIVDRLEEGGMFVASIRDYDELLKTKPPYSPPYIHKTENGQRVSFQTWEWEGEKYKLVQYIIEDEKDLTINKFECEYRATRRAELTELLTACGCKTVEWKFPEETGFYQPIVIAKKFSEI